MIVKKIVITSGIYKDQELRLLVSFDENNKPLDLINLNITKIGEVHIATVEKVLNDIDACIVKMDSGDKGFIENKKLRPDFFIEKHSEKKLVCQSDKFYVQISQDRKGVKPYSCNFIESDSKFSSTYGFINYYFDKYTDKDCEIITDIEDYIIQEFNDSKISIRKYEDEDISLWNLYGLSGLLDKISSKVVHLKSGANLIIEPTEAMTIVDVNSSKNYGKSTPLETNVEALEELSRQLRLRSISGIIILDLLKISKKQEEMLIEDAKDLFKNDISIIQIHGFTNLGLLELTRSRCFAPINI